MKISKALINQIQNSSFDVLKGGTSINKIFIHSGKRLEKESKMNEGQEGQEMEERDPVAKTIVIFTDNLAKLSAQVFKHTNDKLRSVSWESVPIPTNPEKIEAASLRYPPLFQLLQDNFKIIESNLNGILECLDRVEL